MFITIAGNLGSGKSTVCKILEEKHGFSTYSTGKIQRGYAETLGISTLEMNRLMNTDPKYDHIIDDEVVRISEEKQGEKIIFDSRMAWHFVKRSLKVFLIIDPAIAAQRVISTRTSTVEQYQSVEDAKKQLLERAKTENVRYKQIYGVDNLDYRNYDLIIDTSILSPEEVAEKIYDAYCQGEDFIKQETMIYISPQNVYPTQKITEMSDDTFDYYRSLKVEEYLPIDILAFGGYHFVIDGNHRVLAAMNKKYKVIPARIIHKDEYPFYSKEENVLRQLRAIGLTSVYDFEAIGKFKYNDYPSYYGSGK